MKKNVKRLFIFMPLFLLLFTLSVPIQTYAASKPAQITGCKLTSSKNVKVTVSIKNPKKIRGKKCYLFALSLSDTKIKKSMRPVQSKKKAKKMTFTVPLDSTKPSSRLYSRFVLASKNKNGTYSVISNARYISNPKKVAAYKYAFPTAVSKKGLQVSADKCEIQLSYAIGCIRTNPV